MFIAVRDLRHARGRFALMASVIALISLLVVLLTGLTAGLSRESTAAVATLPTDRVAFAQPAQGAKVGFATSRVTTAQLATARRQPGVVDADLLGISPTRISFSDNANTPAAGTAFGVDPGSPAAPTQLADGTAVLDETLARQHGISVGDRVLVGSTSLRVSALRDHETYDHTPVVWVPRQIWSGLDAAGHADGSVLTLHTGPGFDAAAFDRATGMVSQTPGQSLSAIGSYAAENGSLTLMRVLLLAVSVLVVGAFFTVWTIQRTPDLAVLKAVGASTGYLVRDALGQAAVVLLLGGAIGTLVASAVGMLAGRAVPIVLAPATTLVPLAALVLVGLVGATASLRRIATVDPLTALGAAR